MNRWLTAKNALIGLAVALLLGAIGGMTMGWVLWVRPKSQKPILQTYEPRKKNGDGSYRAEKTPTSNPEPKQEMPKDAKPKATISAVVRPHGPRATVDTKVPGTSEMAPQPQLSSGPSDVRIDATIYQTNDGQDHLVVSSPDGEVVAANYSPAVKRVIESNLKNAVGLFVGFTTAPARELGVFYDRDLAWVRWGVEGSQIEYLNIDKKEYAVRFKGGIRF